MPPEDARRQRLSRLWDYLVKSINQFTAHSMEADLAWQLHQSLPNFLFGFESAAYDAGLLVQEDGPSVDQTASYSDRLLATKELYGSQEVIIALDVKQINPRLCAKDRGGIYFFGFAVQQTQDKCAALIIVNAAAPELVACVPISYLRGLRQPQRGGPTRYYPSESPLTSSITPPFPIRLSPFVFPREHLGQSLESLLAFKRGTVSVWSNPFNGIDFDDLHDPPLVAVDELCAAPENGLHDEETIQRLQIECSTYDSGYSVYFPDVRPCGGDFIIRHNDTNELYLAELKLGAWKAATKRRKEKRNFNMRLGRTPLISWELLVLTSTDQSTGLVLCVDEIPDSWMLERVKEQGQGSYYYVMTATHDFWSKRTFCLNEVKVQKNISSPRRFPELLDELRAEGKLQARTNAKPDIAWGDRILQGTGYRRPIYNRLFAVEADGRKSRGSGRQRAPILLSAARATKINAQCQSVGFGNLFHLGTHPSGAYVFCDGRYTGESGTSFYDLSLDTPMLYLNFAEVDHLGRYHAHDDRACLSFLHCTHGKVPSVYLIRTRTREGDTRPPVQYLVPSETLATTDRFEVNNEYINESKKPREVILYLSEGELLDCYRLLESNIVSALRKTLRMCAQTAEKFTFGRGVQVDGSKYITTRREVMNQFLDVLLDRLPWKQLMDFEEEGMEEDDDVEDLDSELLS